MFGIVPVLCVAIVGAVAIILLIGMLVSAPSMDSYKPYDQESED